MAYITFESKKIYYETYGSGTPIMILNGIMMSCASWKEFIEPFSAYNQLILVDMLDQGRSDKMDGPFSQALQVEVIKELLDQLEIEKVNLVGISYGGEVAQQFAIKYGNRLDKLVLFNTTPCTGAWLKDIGDAWNLASGNWEAYYLTTIPVIYSPSFYKKYKNWMAKRKNALKTVFSDEKFISSMIRLTNSAAEYDVEDHLHQIKAPTLVVSCQEDYLTPMDEQKRIVEKIPNSELVILPGCGHASMYEKPVLFASLVLGFVNNPKREFHIVS